MRFGFVGRRSRCHAVAVRSAGQRPALFPMKFTVRSSSPRQNPATRGNAGNLQPNVFLTRPLQFGVARKSTAAMEPSGFR